MFLCYRPDTRINSSVPLLFFSESSIFICMRLSHSNTFLFVKSVFIWYRIREVPIYFLIIASRGSFNLIIKILIRFELNLIAASMKELIIRDRDSSVDACIVYGAVPRALQVSNGTNSCFNFSEVGFFFFFFF